MAIGGVLVSSTQSGCVCSQWVRPTVVAYESVGWTELRVIHKKCVDNDRLLVDHEVQCDVIGNGTTESGVSSSATNGLGVFWIQLLSTIEKQRSEKSVCVFVSLLYALYLFGWQLTSEVGPATHVFRIGRKRVVWQRCYECLIRRVRRIMMPGVHKRWQGRGEDESVPVQRVQVMQYGVCGLIFCV